MVLKGKVSALESSLGNPFEAGSKDEKLINPLYHPFCNSCNYELRLALKHNAERAQKAYNLKEKPSKLPHQDNIFQ